MTRVIRLPGRLRWASLLGRLRVPIVQWREKARRRRAWQRLGPHLMKDIGLSQADIWWATSRTFTQNQDERT